MNAAVNEVINDVWWRIRFEKIYQSMLTTPITVTDIALGEAAAAMLRALVAATCFLGVIAALGLVHTWWALLAVPATLLITFAFAGAGRPSRRDSESSTNHQYVQLVMLPTFLFAATFYPSPSTPSRCRWSWPRCRCTRAPNSCAESSSANGG